MIKRRPKPILEEVINEYLDGDIRKTALDLVAFLRKNDMPPKQFRDHGWIVDYKGQKRFCVIWIHSMGVDDPDSFCNPPAWSINLKSLINYEGHLIKEGAQNKIWDNVVYCIPQNAQFDKSSTPVRPCAGGRNTTLLGKDFDGICQKRDVWQFYDPCEATAEDIKKLIEIEKKVLDDAYETKQENINEPKYTPDRSITEQKLTKPMAEDIIPLYLEGDMKENALDFAAWLRANGMSPGWYGQNRWKASTSSKPICFLFLESSYLEYKPPLNLRLRLVLPHMKDYENSITDEALKQLIWDNISPCGNCTYCSPGINLPLFGKELKGTCKNTCMGLINPDKAALDNIKKLLLLEKEKRKKVK